MQFQSIGVLPENFLLSQCYHHTLIEIKYFEAFMTLPLQLLYQQNLYWLAVCFQKKVQKRLLTQYIMNQMCTTPAFLKLNKKTSFLRCKKANQQEQLPLVLYVLINEPLQLVFSCLDRKDCTRSHQYL
ncbi:MAG: hypothetical protein A2X58_11795 [Nitrospirae bacterium GWC2_56_14]|nr:MAG: hypothetical protein A2X58_11795 [Nitrospirae bacterium GWC2_56_14]